MSALSRPGLSPRVRGNRADGNIATVDTGSIPACAGEPRIPGLPAAKQKVYPRVCGGTDFTFFDGQSYQGLSPRVRGNRSRPRLCRRRPGSIPACAGEPCSAPCSNTGPRVYPRVCGGTIFASRQTG